MLDKGIEIIQTVEFIRGGGSNRKKSSIFLSRYIVCRIQRAFSPLYRKTQPPCWRPFAASFTRPQPLHPTSTHSLLWINFIRLNKINNTISVFDTYTYMVSIYDAVLNKSFSACAPFFQLSHFTLPRKNVHDKKSNRLHFYLRQN